ncbi:MAG: hypothetical protein IPK75_12870 [Acidobacteria bacterium]|nr:hypothetical protein [Acidobacteriota bacterium]
MAMRGENRNIIAASIIAGGMIASVLIYLHHTPYARCMRMTHDFSQQFAALKPGEKALYCQKSTSGR